MHLPSTHPSLSPTHPPTHPPTRVEDDARLHHVDAHHLGGGGGGGGLALLLLLLLLLLVRAVQGGSTYVVAGMTLAVAMAVVRVGGVRIGRRDQRVAALAVHLAGDCRSRA